VPPQPYSNGSNRNGIEEPASWPKRERERERKSKATPPSFVRVFATKTGGERYLCLLRNRGCANNTAMRHTNAADRYEVKKYRRAKPPGNPQPGGPREEPKKAAGHRVLQFLRCPLAPEKRAAVNRSKTTGAVVLLIFTRTPLRCLLFGYRLQYERTNLVHSLRSPRSPLGCNDTTAITIACHLLIGSIRKGAENHQAKPPLLALFSFSLFARPPPEPAEKALSRAAKVIAQL